MKSINHRNIRLTDNNSGIHETTIVCELPLPRFILDGKGRLFKKNKTIHEPNESSKVNYFEVGVVHLSSVEVVAEAIGVASQA